MIEIFARRQRLQNFRQRQKAAAASTNPFETASTNPFDEEDEDDLDEEDEVEDFGLRRRMATKAMRGASGKKKKAKSQRGGGARQQQEPEMPEEAQDEDEMPEWLSELADDLEVSCR